MRPRLLVVGNVPYLPANSVTAVFIEVTEPTALVTRDEAMVENTLGTMTMARMAMMASTPIISTRLNPVLRLVVRRRLGDGSIFMGMIARFRSEYQPDQPPSLGRLPYGFDAIFLGEWSHGATGFGGYLAISGSNPTQTVASKGSI